MGNYITYCYNVVSCDADTSHETTIVIGIMRHVYAMPPGSSAHRRFEAEYGSLYIKMGGGNFYLWSRLTATLRLENGKNSYSAVVQEMTACNTQRRMGRVSLGDSIFINFHSFLPYRVVWPQENKET